LTPDRYAVFLLEMSNYDSYSESTLPSWLFDISEYDDEINTSTNLLKELDIDIVQITENISFNFIYPVRYVLNKYNRIGFRNDESHPLMNTNNIDFWGPTFCVSALCVCLWFGEVRFVAWIYLIWLAGSLFNHLVTRVWLDNRAKLYLHFAILGYSCGPLIPFILILVIFNVSIFFSYMIILSAITYSTIAAYSSYRIIYKAFNIENYEKNLYLIIPSLVLMNLYILSFIPLR
jgi:hypothetical protein